MYEFKTFYELLKNNALKYDELFENAINDILQ